MFATWLLAVLNLLVRVLVCVWCVGFSVWRFGLVVSLLFALLWLWGTAVDLYF